MKDEFEKRLNDRIAEVFDHYEDDSAEEAWGLLREKYPEKEKRPGAFWLWMGSAAAILLLLLGIWIWNDNVHPKPTRLSAKINLMHETKINKSPVDSSPLSSSSSKIPSLINPQTPVQSSTNTQIQKYASPSVRVKNITASSHGKQQPVAGVNNPTANQSQIPAIINEQETIQPAKKAEPKNIVANPSAISQPSADTATVKSNVAQNDAKPAKPPVKSPFTQNDPVIKKNKIAGNNNSASPVTFGVYAATYLNYASGSSSQVNVGAGLATDVHIAKNLKLSTGIAINQNSLSYGNNLPPRSNTVALAAAAAPLHTSFAGANTAFSYNIPVLKNYDAQFTSLDVPLNLKYELNPEKNSSFISLGLSSGTFITETYSSQYGYANSSTQTQNSNTSSFSNFYFAKTLDVSFGFGYPIGKNRLSVEPFVKYPLQGLGADQIKFGAGGLNLKFNFNNGKK